jgi:hypothetical protein
MLRNACILIAYLTVSSALAFAQSLAAEAPADANEVALSVTVFGPDGGPLAGAAVRALAFVEDVPDGRLALRGQAKTGPDGKAAFHWRPAASEMPHGLIVVRKNGAGMTWDRWRRQDGPDLSLSMGRGQSVSGVVVDDANSPIAGAEVLIEATTDTGMVNSTEGMDWFTTNTDDRGRFRFDGLPSWSRLEFLARAAGRATTGTLGAGRSGQFTPPRSDIRIVMRPEAKIEGVIVEKETGKPIAGVFVVSQGGLPRTAQWAVSDADGRFTISRLTPGAQRVWLGVVGRGLQDWVCPQVSPSPVAEAGKTVSVRLEPTRGGILEVAVTDANSKSPVADAYMAVSGKNPKASYDGWTDAGGIVRLRVLPGEVTVSRINAVGYESFPNSDAAGLPAAARADKPAPVTVSLGQTLRTTVGLDPLPRQRGIIRDPQGKPLPGASIQSAYSTLATTGPDGRFEMAIRNTPFGEEWRMVFAFHEQRGLAGALELPPDGKPIDAKLMPAGSIKIKAQDPNAAAIGGATVQLYVSMGQTSVPIHNQNLRTGPDGTAITKPLCRDQKYWVQVQAEGFGQAQRTFSLEEGDALTLDPFVLPRANLTLAGVVLDANDSPLANVQVYVYGNSQQMIQVETDNQGRFRLSNIIDGAVEVQANVSMPGGDSWYGNVRCKGGDTDVRIALRQRAGADGVFRSVANLSRPLKGKPLAKLDALGLADAAGKAAGRRVLLCFWDIDQRPSRRCIQLLQAKLAELEAGRAGAPAAGVTVLAVQTAEADAGEPNLKKWLDDNKITIPVGSLPAGQDGQKLRNSFGVARLPWLILTDDKHIVRAEGFAVEELADKLSAGPATRPAPGATALISSFWLRPKAAPRYTGQPMKKHFEADFRHFAEVMHNRRPARVPLYEHIVSPE